MTDTSKEPRKRETRGRKPYPIEQKKIAVFARIRRSTHRILLEDAKRRKTTISDVVRDVIEKEYGGDK
jgi:hypothetical protein